jgi:tRNA (cmo5U34)-methyltransferase
MPGRHPATAADNAVNRRDTVRSARFQWSLYTATWLSLSDVNGSRLQPAHRCSSPKPPISASDWMSETPTAPCAPEPTIRDPWWAVVRRKAEAMNSWKDPDKVAEYTGRVGRLAARRAGEAELLEAVPDSVTTLVDLGCGDGRLMSLVLDARPELTTAIGLDNSPPMLDLARQRFERDTRVTIVEHDLDQGLRGLDEVDAVISGFAIHHLSHQRKQSLFREVVTVLRSGGVFVNLEVVQCATQELHEEFNRRIERPGGDPQDVLAEVEPQLEWMRDAGLIQVDCNWRWRGFALLVGQAPAMDSAN